MQISFNVNSIVKKLGIIAVILVLLSVITQIISYQTGHPSIYGLVPFFNVDDECNLPTLFSTLILLIAAVLLAVISYFNWDIKNRDKFYWGFLSIGFIYMSFDEIFKIHEKFSRPVKSFFEYTEFGIFYFAWVIPIGMIVLVVFFIYLKFLIRLNPKTRLNFVIAAMFYVVGAIGFELLGGFIMENYGGDNFIYEFVVTLEESLEITGIIIFIKSLLEYIFDQNEMLQIKAMKSNKV